MEPQPDPWLLDRFLIMAEAADITASIVVNKIDLVAGDEFSIRQKMGVYERAGYRIWYVSARQNIGIDALREELRGKISAFAGPSGVGKSRMINALCPGLDLRVGEIGYITYKGRHTTTSAETYPARGRQGGVGRGYAWLASTGFLGRGPRRHSVLLSRVQALSRRVPFRGLPTPRRKRLRDLRGAG